MLMKQNRTTSVGLPILAALILNTLSFGSAVAGERELKFGGWAQLLWNGEFDDEGVVGNEFRVRRGRLKASGDVSDDVDFNALVDLTAGKILQDFYFDYVVGESLVLRAGQCKLPMGRQFYTSAAKKQFVDSTSATSEFALGRDIGLMAHGEFGKGKLEYQMGVFNGSGKNARQDNTDVMYVGRLVVNPLGKVALSESDIRGSDSPLVAFGLASAFNTVTEEGGTAEARALQDLDIWTVGGELTFVYSGLYLSSELFWRLSSPRESVIDMESGGDLAGAGAHVQAGYFLIPERLEIGARGALVRKDLDADDDDEIEAGPVLNWFFEGHGLKLQADYTALIDEEPGEDSTTDHMVRLQLQASF